jgi:hypothetical protein
MLRRRVFLKSECEASRSQEGKLHINDSFKYVRRILILRQDHSQPSQYL